MPSSSLAEREAPWKARAVVSHPPPAAAGAMIDSWRAGNGLEASSPPDAPPGAAIATTATAAKAAPISTLEPILSSQVPRNGRATILARRAQVLHRRFRLPCPAVERVRRLGQARAHRDAQPSSPRGRERRDRRQPLPARERPGQAETRQARP